jgi:hypothetical protein
MTISQKSSSLSGTKIQGEAHKFSAGTIPYLWVCLPFFAVGAKKVAKTVLILSGQWICLPLPLQYPSPLCRLTWAVTHVIGLHIELTILGECDVASTTILGMLMSNIVLTVDTRAL